MAKHKSGPGNEFQAEADTSMIVNNEYALVVGTPSSGTLTAKGLRVRSHQDRPVHAH